MYKGTAAGYMGAEWVRASLRVGDMSEFGARVADLLGDLFQGIYHLDSDKLLKVDWSSTHHIEFALGWKSMSTFDDSLLTHLVLLAHQRAIRVEISGRTHHFLTLRFHPREHGHEEWYRYHPTIEEAVRQFNKVYRYSGDDKPERNALMARCPVCGRAVFISTTERRVILDSNDDILDLLLDGYDLVFTDVETARSLFGCECEKTDQVEPAVEEAS